MKESAKGRFFEKADVDLFLPAQGGGGAGVKTDLCNIHSTACGLKTLLKNGLYNDLQALLHTLNCIHAVLYTNLKHTQYTAYFTTFIKDMGIYLWRSVEDCVYI